MLKQVVMKFLGTTFFAVAFLPVNSSATSDTRFVLQPANGAIVAQGRQVYAENCASCHGENLEGEPNWRQPNADLTMPAPPHDDTGHTWHHTDEVLFNLTKYGLAKYLNQPNFKSNMPAYENILSDDEIKAVLSFIKSQWSDAIRKRNDQLNSRQ